MFEKKSGSAKSWISVTPVLPPIKSTFTVIRINVTTLHNIQRDLPVLDFVDILDGYYVQYEVI